MKRHVNGGHYKFTGRHLLATYSGCDRMRLTDTTALIAALRHAAEVAGATVVGQANYIFESKGLTAVVLLKESHASIHTYPEYGACYVDLFTCGETCLAEEFDAAMREYLAPTDATWRVILRSTDMEDDDFHPEVVESVDVAQ